MRNLNFHAKATNFKEFEYSALKIVIMFNLNFTWNIYRWRNLVYIEVTYAVQNYFQCDENLMKEFYFFLSKEYELCNVEHYENWWIYPYWHPCLYSVYSKSSLMWNAFVSGFCSTSFTILCDFWLWNALKRFCGCFQKNDNEMNEVMKIIDDWWSVCWILVRIGTTIKTEFWHWHLKQKMRIY